MPESTQPKTVFRSVLVVEDDHRLAELLSEVLTFENCVVDLAGNGMEALEKLASASPDVVICDMMMPLMDGRSFYEEVVKRHPFLAERFLFISGTAAALPGTVEFISRSNNALLSKPFEIDQFRVALAELFAR